MPESVQIAGTMFFAFDGIVNEPAKFAQAVVAEQFTALPLTVPLAPTGTASGAIRAKFVPSVGSVVSAPHVETNVPGIVSIVPELLSCTKPRRIVVFVDALILH